MWVQSSNQAIWNGSYLPNFICWLESKTIKDQMSRFRIVEKLGDVKIKGWGTQIWSLKQDQRLAGKSALMVRHPKETLSPLVTFNTLLTQLDIDFASWSLCLWKLGNSRESQDKSFPTSQRFSSQYQLCWREALIMIEVWSLVLYSCSCVFVCIVFTLCSYKPCACHVVFWSKKSLPVPATPSSK